MTTYRDHLGYLLGDVGKYVVIKGGDILGVFDELETAVDAATRFSPEPVLVEKIAEKEPIREVSHVLS